jgi:2-oxoisovalerate dehydrogenase E1 component
MWYKEQLKIADNYKKNKPLVLCSLGDASVTEGEVAEAFQMACLKQLPIIYLVQDNEWDISASADEVRTQNAFEYAKGFHGLEAITIEGNDFLASYKAIQEVIKTVRKERRPFLIHAKVPLLNHHTSGVRMEWYRDDLEEDKKMDPFPIFRKQLLDNGIKSTEIDKILAEAEKEVHADFQRALAAEEPDAAEIHMHHFAPSKITEEKGRRAKEGGEEIVMVDCALHAVRELMEQHDECLLYGQDVGLRLGGVFREAATLAQKFGSARVFNTPIQEAFIVGSTVGMSAVGLKPIVEVQFADYIWPGLNQLFTEVSRSCYLSNGKWPVSMILRVPIGAYGSGGPYHSGSVESVLSNIKGIKIAYPSNGADMKGLMKAAYYDPNPVVMLEHKGLYWSKVPGTEQARVIEPGPDYILPFGKSRIVCESDAAQSNTISIITYGMGVHWAINAAKNYEGQVEIVDLRTIYPLDETGIFESVKRHNKCLIITEEPVANSFARSIAGLIQEACFEYLDAPIKIIGSENLPAVPLNSILEKAMLPNADKVSTAIAELLAY